MQRCISTNAIIIRRERSGEFHKGLTLLTSDLGLVRATAYGAYKMQSRLRMASEPFTHCAAELYHNPVSHTYKVTELEVRESFPHLQGELPRIATASLWVEVVQKSYAAGELSDQLYRLFVECLRVLDAAATRDIPYVAIQFLWRFLALSGSQPDITRCDACGRPFGESTPAFYDPRVNGLCCEACRLPSDLSLPAGGRRYLDASSSLTVAQAAALRLEVSSLPALREAILGITQAVLEKELSTIRYLGAAT
jgi:DNA repair protein RecO (recombination protein O)